MEKCPLCSGEKKAGTTVYTVDLGFGLVIVRNVHAKLCSQCGEEWIEDKAAKELEKIVENARLANCQLEVVPFQFAAT